jgi:NADH dehydrogenase
MSANTSGPRPRVVIIGAGFGGLYAARALKNKEVDVLLIDRQNYHLFTPLLYQVATCGLEPEEIAYPVRGIFRGATNTDFLMGEVVRIDVPLQSVEVRTNGHTRTIPYDYLIVAAGSVTNYFGQQSVEQHGFGLKDLSEAVTLRNHILTRFERAAWSDDAVERERLTTMVVIGGGPTGLETAGAMRELFYRVLRKEYPFLRTMEARVVLVEALDRLLTPFPEALQVSALEQARSLGIEVILNNPVSGVTENEVRLQDGTTIPTQTLVWAAGVKASPLTAMLGVELKRGRVPIKPTTEVIGLNRVYVIGDMAHLEDENGQPYPMLIPVAQQQGTLAAKNILRRERVEAEKAFRYFDRGIMATIGRSRAVAYIFNKLPISGYPAWISWLVLHLLVLMGFRNRINVLVNWIWEYWTYDRSVRIILRRDDEHPDADETMPSEVAPTLVANS